MYKVLAIDDTETILKIVSLGLQDSFEVICCNTGQKGLDALEKNSVDFIVLDLVLPDMSGYEICSYLQSHENYREIPIIIISSKADVHARITGYELGACNYLEKPFKISELKAIISSMVRKNTREVKKTITIGGLDIDLLKQKVNFNGKVIALTSSEFKIFCFMAQREGDVISREKLLNIIHPQDLDIQDRVIDTHISSLRKKLRPTSIGIKAIYKEGYTLVAEIETKETSKVS